MNEEAANKVSLSPDTFLRATTEKVFDNSLGALKTMEPISESNQTT